MPLIKREIEPVFVSRSSTLEAIPKGVPELECLTNITLSSVMLQLSNLARHAEDLFGELYNEANFLYKKSCMLQGRIDVLVVQVTRLDAINDKETLEGFMNQTPYQNTFITDQIILGTETLPVALKEARSRCDKVPPLGDLDQYREDGKEALKFYTNPGYFFELWCEDMQKNITDDHKKRQKRKRKKRERKNSNKPTKLKTRKDQFQHMAAGQEFMPNKPKEYNRAIQSPDPVPNGQSADSDRRQSMNDRRQSQMADDRRQSQGADQHEYSNSLSPPEGGHENKRHSHSRPGRKAPAPPPSSPENSNLITNYHYNPDENRMSLNPMEDPRTSQYGNIPNVPEGGSAPLPPPPPPMPGTPNFNPSGQLPPMPMDPNMPPPPPLDEYGMSPMQTANIPAPPPPPPPEGMMQHTQIPQNSNIPAPPPPPPPGGVGPPPMASTPAASKPSNRMSQLPIPKEEDGRSDLLKAIQSGMNLKKVKVNENKGKKQNMPANSVEAILQRRLEALQLSDSEDESSDESWTSSDD